MHLHRSNRVEALLAQLARLVEQPQADPLAAECIVVQGRGMERWLSLALANRLGVFAHPDFPFPRLFLQRVLGEVLGDDPAPPGEPRVDAAFEPGNLMWSIAELIPTFAGDPRFAPVIHYLDGETQGEKALQLARRIADTLDHYGVYRPDWVLAWERGAPAPESGLSQRDEGWQAPLWRALVERHGSCHLAARTARFVEALAADAPAPGRLPARISVFGISTLPPLFLSAFNALAQRVELHFFVLSPSREYWGQIRSLREQARAAAREPESETEDPEALHLEEGHPLLASLGRLGRDFQEILEAGVDYRESEEDLYRDPLEESGQEASMLSVLQSDVLNLRDRGGPRGEVDRQRVAPDDRSIQVHGCHSPMREAEVLRDQLLDLFERDPSLEPRDVIVMTPDVDLYAPFIEAAFGPEAGGGTRSADSGMGHGAIPCRVADRGARSVYEVAEAFFRLLDVLSGRLSASAVLDLLATPCIRDRFGFVEADEPVLGDWIREAGVRWGIDADHRAQEGQPAAVDNTWRFGLDRLLVGYAMADREGRFFGGVRPLDAVHGGEAVLLGRFAEFTGLLFDFHGRVEKAQGLRAWSGLLSNMLERMFVTTGETEHQLQWVRDALGDLVQAGERAGFTGALTLSALRDQLDAWIARKPPAGGFLAGGVTFCELVPMRSIPFRVVCLMGLSDGDFPRVRRRLGFDLLARRSRPGDRSSREDDRYLFLEALLSARDYFLVTYRGQDERDNKALPPSVVVGELLDHLNRAFFRDARADGSEDESTRGVRDAVLLAHPLQPFSPRYFDPRGPDPRLFSYSQTGYAGACALGGERVELGRFVPQPLSPPAEAPSSLALDELVDFYRNPARSLLRNRLGLFLADEVEAQPDREPMELVGLEYWRVGDELIADLGAEEEAALARQRIRGLGILPLGEAGEAAYEDVEAEARKLFARGQSLRAGDEHPPLDLDCPLAGVRLVGRLDGIWDAGRVQVRFSKLEGRWELEEWIRHLAFCAAGPEGGEPATHLVGRPAARKIMQIRFGFVEEARAELEQLMAIYFRGQRVAIPFFPKTSRKYLTTLVTPKPRGDAEKQASQNAYKFWRPEGNDSGPAQPGTSAEVEDPYFSRVFGNQDPLAPSWYPVEGEEGDGFRSLARRVYGPLLSHREEISG
jgi:exodeoxyribonuclease V gamma subunit